MIADNGEKLVNAQALTVLLRLLLDLLNSIDQSSKARTASLANSTRFEPKKQW